MLMMHMQEKMMCEMQSDTSAGEVDTPGSDDNVQSSDFVYSDISGSAAKHQQQMLTAEVADTGTDGSVSEVRTEDTVGYSAGDAHELDDGMTQLQPTADTGANSPLHVNVMSTEEVADTGTDGSVSEVRTEDTVDYSAGDAHELDDGTTQQPTADTDANPQIHVNITSTDEAVLSADGGIDDVSASLPTPTSEPSSASASVSTALYSTGVDHLPNLCTYLCKCYHKQSFYSYIFLEWPKVQILLNHYYTHYTVCRTKAENRKQMIRKREKF